MSLQETCDMKRSIITTALVLLLGISIGAPSTAAPTAPPQSSSSHHTKKTEHAQKHPATSEVHPIVEHRATVHTTTTVKTHATVTTHHVMQARPATTHVTTRRTV